MEHRFEALRTAPFHRWSSATAMVLSGGRTAGFGDAGDDSSDGSNDDGATSSEDDDLGEGHFARFNAVPFHTHPGKL